MTKQSKLTKITKLTPEQEQQIAVYRDRYFKLATSTKPVDLEEGKRAALRLAELAGVDNCEIVIVDNPYEGYNRWNSIRDSLSVSLGDSLRVSLRVSLGDSLWNSIWESISDSLRDSIWESISDSLSDSIWESISDSLRDSLRDSISDSLSDSLRDSIWDIIWDANWLAYYTYAVEVLSIECSNRHRELLKCYTTIAENFSALWIVPGKIILCNKPTNVTIKNGEVTDMQWSD